MWSVWRREASNHIELIEERHFDFTTIAMLYQPRHASYRQKLCEQDQLFTAEAYAVVQNALERCSPQGVSPGMG